MALRAVVGVVALALAVMFYQAMVLTKSMPPQSENVEVSIPVQVMTTRFTSSPPAWEGYGTVRPLAAAEVAAQVAGEVVERPARVEPGEPIERGEVIVGVDRADFEQRLARTQGAIESTGAELEGLAIEEASIRETLSHAQSATELTQRDLDRLQEAADRGAARANEVDRLRRDLARFRIDEENIRQRLQAIPSRRSALKARETAEKASAELARIDLARTKIRAPIGGVIQHVKVDIGDRVSIGTPVARIVNLDRVEAPIRLPVSSLRSIQVGDDASLTIDSPDSPSWKGAIARIAPEADGATRTIEVYVEVEQRDEVNPNKLLRSGQFVIARIVSASEQMRILVPRSAVQGDRVLVVDDEGRARTMAVSVEQYVDGARPGLAPDVTQWAVIRTGLTPGDRVIVSNLDDLRPGVRVETVEVSRSSLADLPTPVGAASVNREAGVRP